MADTVEQVHVWDGSDWVPVVRDECNLPIESVDETVKLDGDASVFSVSTGGEERVVVDTDSLHFKDSLRADFEQSGGQACGRIQGYDDKFFVQTLNSKPLYVRVAGADDLQIFPSNHYVRARIGLQAGLGSAGLPAYGFYNDTDTGIYSPSDDTIAVSTGGKERLTVTDDAAIFDGQIQTDKIISENAAAEDGYFDLSSGLGYVAGDHAVAIVGGQQNTDEHTALVVSACALKPRRGFHFLTATATGRANGSAIIDVRSTDSGTVTPGEEVAEFHVRLDGKPVLDATPSDFTVSTGGEERVRVDKDGHVGVNKNDPRSNTQLEVKSDANSPYTLILDGSSSTGFDGRSGLRMYNGSFIQEFASDPNTQTYGFSGGQSGGSQIISDGGMAFADIEVSPQQWVQIRTQIQTPSVTGLADNDAEVTLNSNFTVSTNNVDNRLTINSRGMAGLGNAASNSSCLYVNSVPTNAIGLNGIVSIPKIITADAVDVAALKTQIDLASGVALTQFSHLISGSSAGSGTAGTVNGVRIVNTSLSGTSKNVAFSTDLPEDGLKNYSIETGTAPSYFGGQIQTPSITGVNATNAAISLGDQATIAAGDGSVYEPTNPASIATKAYADTKADLWVGTQAEYDALGIYNNQTLYCITD